MWRNVDNPLSARGCTGKLCRGPVDNDCGQMCTTLWSDEKNRVMRATFGWHSFTSF